MNYSRQQIINKVIEIIQDSQKIKELYKKDFINYRGKTTDTKEFITEVVAAELLIEDIFLNSLSSLIEVERESYIVVSHDGVIHNPGSNRHEENFCKDLFSYSRTEEKKLAEIGMILDYQVPLKKIRGDSGVGKIDLISTTDDTIWLLELKYGANTETILRCILEIATYYQLLNKVAFIKSYPLLSKHIIRKGILVIEGSSQEDELKEMKQNERSNLKTLMEILNVEAFTINKDTKAVIRI